jgi:hypothetical protein
MKELLLKTEQILKNEKLDPKVKKDLLVKLFQNLDILDDHFKLQENPEVLKKIKALKNKARKFLS